ncbi:MAG TPA: glycosyltransferase family 9 protein [Chloroflexota bacterium]
MLVLRPGALGDTLLAVPALRALRRAVAPITLAAQPSAARLLCSLGEVDRGMAFDDPSLAPLFGADPPSETVVAWMNAEAAPALRHAAVLAPSRPTGREHCARYLLRSLAPLGIDLTWRDQPLATRPILSDEVLIHPGSGSASKNWPAERFAAVIRGLQRPVRLVVGEADLAPAAAIDAALGYRLPRLDCPSLEDLSRHLAGCAAYLGNDSGVSHLAGLCGARTVALFGPSDPEVWHPIGPDVYALGFDTDIAPVIALLERQPGGPRPVR